MRGILCWLEKNTSCETIFEPYISCMNNFPMSEAKALMQLAMNLNVNICGKTKTTYVHNIEGFGESMVEHRERSYLKPTSSSSNIFDRVKIHHIICIPKEAK